MFEETTQKLKTRLGRIEANRRSLLETVEREQRDGLTEDERRQFDGFTTEIEEVEARLAELEADEKRMASARAAATKLGIYGESAKITSQPLTYAKGDHRTSYVRDVVRSELLRDVEARERLARHAQEVAQAPEFKEFRALDRTDGNGGVWVPPAWLMNQWIEYARPGRPVANLIRSQSLPGGTDSVNVPRVKLGTKVDIQPADGQPVTTQDMQDDSINLPVRTLAGSETLSIQLVDQSPLNFDEVIFTDLLADYAMRTDLQVLNGNGSSGQVTGFLAQTGTTQVTASANTGVGVYSAIANAVQKIHTTRFQSPTVIAMSPQRWGWFVTQLDGSGRPLVTPRARTTSVNAMGSFDVAAQGPAGDILGLPVILDPNLGSAGTEPILVLRPEDDLLYESPIRTRVLPEVGASNLQLTLQVYGYIAFSAARYPQSCGIVTGLTAPSW